MLIIRILVAAVAFIHFGGTDLLPKTAHIPTPAHLNAPHGALSHLMIVVAFVSGALIVIGLLTRLATMPLIILALLAIVSSKLPQLNAQSVLFFHAADADRYGAWSIIHDVRADFVILFGCVFLLYEGAGRLSADWWIASRRRFKPSSTPIRSRLPRPGIDP